MTVASLVCQFGQQLFQSVAPSRHRHVVFSKAGSRAEVVATVPHVKYPLVLCTSVAAFRQVELQNFPLAQVDRAPLAVVGVVVPHLHVALLVDAGWVGEDVVNGRTQLRRPEDPLYEHGVGVGYDYAVDGTFVLRDKREQVRHAGREGDGLHYAADPGGTDLLLPWTHIRGDNRSSLEQGRANLGPQRLLRYTEGPEQEQRGVFGKPTS